MITEYKIVDDLEKDLEKQTESANYWRIEAERWRDVAGVVDDKIEIALAELVARVETLERKLQQFTDYDP